MNCIGTGSKKRIIELVAENEHLRTECDTYLRDCDTYKNDYNTLYDEHVKLMVKYQQQQEVIRKCKKILESTLNVREI